MGAMSYPLAYVFTLLHGRLGHSGWRWMFTMYGLLTSIVALFAYVFIVDFPDKARFLTDEQKELVHTRIERDRNDADPDTITVRKFVVYLLDWHIWVAGFFLAATSCAGYSLTYFLPSILASMGFAGEYTASQDKDSWLIIQVWKSWSSAPRHMCGPSSLRCRARTSPTSGGAVAQQ